MDIYQHITGRIIATLETGKKTGESLWSGAGEGTGLPINYSTQRAYTGINVLILWDAARRNGFSSNAWLTYKQATELGGQVRQGEKAELGIFFKPLEKAAVNTDTGEVERGRIPMMKAFYLFNLDQVDGLDRPATVAPNEFTAIENAERVLQMSGARITIGGTQALASTPITCIYMPFIAASIKTSSKALGSPRIFKCDSNRSRVTDTFYFKQECLRRELSQDLW